VYTAVEHWERPLGGRCRGLFLPERLWFLFGFVFPLSYGEGESDVDDAEHPELPSYPSGCGDASLPIMTMPN
jgi:hypothetical protein